MRKLMTFQHFDSGKTLKLEFRVFEEDGHWAAQIASQEGIDATSKAPTFYGTTPEQAERQLRKVFEKEYDLVSAEILEP